MKNLFCFFTLSIDLNKSVLKIDDFLDKQDIYKFGLNIIKVIIILILMYIAVKIGNTIINRYVSKQKNFKFSLDDKRAKTVGAILKSVLRYSVYFLGIFGIVEVLFNKIGLTFAGIGGLALGFGTQSLIKDVINGFFILFEDQFTVGDYINVDDKGGIVESIELRVTKIRDFNGDLHIIPNGLITKVTNHSRGNIRIMVDVDVSHDEDLDRAIKLISDLCDKFKVENECVTEGPKVLGISALKEDRITIRVAGKSKPMTQWDTEMKLRKEIREVLINANIKTPYAQVKIVKE
ncbi:mechanosensitive ion channel family protein [Clostridium sp. P21]|uniref:Mechanosensitive ion channel family protein n=1 Tax=Clostridium muellerianum TaxID=2716538 RepID=A0A7Y0EEJ9_9CLOT|nr:mechanosensitive ion channel family protein [Clostridium muellerianum]NMM62049.1 mechanosensitive ion channel family protein [Clostridium muellerianum]